MAAARYWRIVGIETYAGGDLELSELHLYGASGRLDAAATLTSTIAPTAGTLAALQDDNLGTTCRFAAAAVRAGGFAIAWDFGAGNTADNVGLRLGASADQSAFMAGCTLQYSADGSQWQGLASFARYAWPGVGAYTAATAVGDPDYGSVSLLLHFDATDGATVITDSSSRTKSVQSRNGAIISNSQGKFGPSLYSGNIVGGNVVYPSDSDFDMGSQDFTVEFFVYMVALYNGGNLENFLLQHRTGTGYWGFSSWVERTTGFPVFSMCNTSGAIFEARGTAALPVAQWAHFAGTRSGNTLRLFIDGAVASSIAINGAAFGPFDPLVFFGTSNADSRFKFNGYIDEARITKGVARYTANFTPPTAPFPNSVVRGGAALVSPNLHTAHSAAQIAASAPVPAHSTRSAPRLQSARDVEHGGPGTIYGTTKTKGTPNLPTKARVVLLHQRSKLPVRETWSDPVTGAFAFTGIDTNQQFLTLAEDAAGNFRPVAANRLTPEVP